MVTRVFCAFLLCVLLPVAATAETTKLTVKRGQKVVLYQTASINEATCKEQTTPRKYKTVPRLRRGFVSGLTEFNQTVENCANQSFARVALHYETKRTGAKGVDVFELQIINVDGTTVAKKFEISVY